MTDLFRAYFSDEVELSKFMNFINGDYKGKIVIFLGDGSNGKSTIENLLKEKINCRKIDSRNILNHLKYLEKNESLTKDIRLLLANEPNEYNPYQYKNIVEECSGFQELINFIEEKNIPCLMSMNVDRNFDKFEDKVIRIKFGTQFVDQPNKPEDRLRNYNYKIDSSLVMVTI